MLGDDFTRDEVLEFLASSAVYGNLGAFIGAGLSKAVLNDDFEEIALSWGELLEQVADELGIEYEDIAKEGKSYPSKKQYKYKGELRTKTVLADETQKPVKLSTLARSINSYFWYRRTVSEETKGPITYEFTRRRVKISNSNLPQKMVWLVIRRTIGSNPDYSYFISNASMSTRLSTFVWLSGLRWAIEQCFEEAKSDLGMDHYEVRKFLGWHHHMITCMLGHFFSVAPEAEFGKKSTVHYALAA